MRSTFVLLLILVILVSRQAAAQNESTAVIELFTSQSCSSCPPADALMTQLAAANPDLIVLSCPVTYWNHLSWRDTLSQEFCTARQNAYASARHSDRVFTPEALINGKQSIVGSNQKKIDSTFRSEIGLVKKINIEKINTGYSADLGNLETQGVTLIVFGKSHTQDITRGENKGKRVGYTNPVIAIHRVEKVAAKLEVPISMIPPHAAGFAILEQTEHGAIKSAGQIKFSAGVD